MSFAHLLHVSETLRQQSYYFQIPNHIFISLNLFQRILYLKYAFHQLKPETNYTYGTTVILITAVTAQLPLDARVLFPLQKVQQ